MLDEAVWDVQISIGDEWRAGLDLQFVVDSHNHIIGANLGDIVLTKEQALKLLDAIN